ncbi:MAG: major facilitator superfamily permease [Chitinophagaceae bacterium]|nr:major facilitator superfamily permease [Chitinophagaceae bacterium]
MEQKVFKNVFNVTVIVAALGYFVDVYDLVLFLVIGKDSIRAIFQEVLTEAEVLQKFQYLLNVQMIGMLVGGIFWGVLGDKKGRLSVLFGSIFVYSIANIANAFVTDMNWYVACRFIAGVGLAGELGAGITLVSESMDKKYRGYGTMVVASIGVTGAVVAGLVGNIGWKTSYLVGGGLGLSLLLLRIGVFESGIFQRAHQKSVSKGNFFYLFSNKRLFFKYLHCILIGLPIWFVIGVLVARAPEIAKTLGVIEPIKQGTCVILCYTGLIFGDLASGGLSQWLQSRKKAFTIFYILCAASIVVYLNLNLISLSATVFYSAVTLLGFSVGFWAMFVTVGSEQFGTNMRATVATTVPNFIRGSLVLIAFVFDYIFVRSNVFWASYSISALLILISFYSLSRLEETFGKDLDYIEDEK